ncbi:MAG: hypothetical protein QM496_02410 [Verrucomicrobiota bacterium]
MNTPLSLKSAANCLIAIGFLYVLMISLIVGMSDHTPDTFGKVFGGCFLGLGLLLWIAAFLLYRQNKAGKYIWWICSPLVLLQFPIGTALGVYVFVYLNKPESKAALAGQVLTNPPPISKS